LALNVCRIACLLQLFASGHGASVLPNNGRRNGQARSTIPHHGGFALVGDADRLNVLCLYASLLAAASVWMPTRAVIDLLEARNHADLARRVDEVATLRFGLIGAVVALEGPARVPAGWFALVEGQADLILGPRKLARMGFHAPAAHLFGGTAPQVKSMALVRLALWEPARQGVLAFASPDPAGFSEDMGSELVAFLARVFERTAERWPVP
jgi:hypothetical protein